MSLHNIGRCVGDDAVPRGGDRDGLGERLEHDGGLLAVDDVGNARQPSLLHDVALLDAFEAGLDKAQRVARLDLAELPVVGRQNGEHADEAAEVGRVDGEDDCGAQAQRNRRVSVRRQADDGEPEGAHLACRR